MTSARFFLLVLSSSSTSVDARLAEVLGDVPGRVRELGEDQHLPAGEVLRLQQPDQLLQLVVVLRLELSGLREEADDLVEVEVGLVEDLVDLVLVARRARSTLSSSSGGTRSSSASVSSSFEPRGQLLLRSRGSRRSGASSVRAAASPRPISLCTSTKASSFSSSRSQDCSNAQTELSNRLRKFVRISPTTWYCRLFSIGSIDSSGPL